MEKPGDEAVKRFERRQAEKRKVTSLHSKREQKLEQKQRQNRLMMLMHSFLDSEEKSDHDAMRMYGRGLSGFTREERQEAYTCALNARKAARPDVPTAAADIAEPAQPEPDGSGAA